MGQGKSEIIQKFCLQKTYNIMGTILARNKLSKKKKITFSAHQICSNYEILSVDSLFPNLNLIKIKQVVKFIYS